MSFISTRYFTKKQEPEANDSRIFRMFSKCPKCSGTRGASFVISLRKHACDARCMHYTDMMNPLSSAEAPVSKHQWKKNTGAGALGRGNRSAGNDGKREKPFPASPARCNLPFPQPPRVFPKRAVKARLQEASAEERVINSTWPIRVHAFLWT